MKHIVILGAGITGLSLAWYLNRAAAKRLKITLIEKNLRGGGFIQTVDKEGFLFERGPRGFLGGKRGERVLSLVDEIGLKEKLIGASLARKKRYLLRNGKLQLVSPGFLLKESLFSSLLKEPFRPKGETEDETVASFFERRMGEKFTETLIDPLIRGIYGGDMHELSMAASFPKLFSFEKDHGSLIKGFLRSPKEKEGLYSFTTGIETLPKRLREKLEGKLEFRFGIFPKRIFPKESGITLEFDNETLHADACVSCIPAYELASLLSSKESFLDQIPYKTMTTLNVGFFGKKLPFPAFGFLVPSNESSDFFGMTFDSEIFPEQNGGEKTRACLIFGGEKTLSEALSHARHILFSLFNINEEPAVFDHAIAKKSIPQYSLGHVSRRNHFCIPSLFVAGNCNDGVGMIDCIDNAFKVAQKIGEKLDL